MHQRLAEVMEYAEQKREALLDSFAGVGEERLARQPVEGAWSVAQILEHLRRTEGSVARLIAKRVADARANGLGEETSTDSVLSTLDHLNLETSQARIEAPAIVQPVEQKEMPQILAGLELSRNALRAAAESADGLAIGEIRQIHPILGELNLYQWIVFVGQHEGRHTKQIERTLRAIPNDVDGVHRS